MGIGQAFEMDKDHGATELQLCVSPVTLAFPGLPEEANLRLSAFQFRGHAMFSDQGTSQSSSPSFVTSSNWG